MVSHSPQRSLHPLSHPSRQRNRSVSSPCSDGATKKSFQRTLARRKSRFVFHQREMSDHRCSGLAWSPGRSIPVEPVPPSSILPHRRHHPSAASFHRLTKESRRDQQRRPRVLHSRAYPLPRYGPVHAARCNRRCFEHTVESSAKRCIAAHKYATVTWTTRYAHEGKAPGGRRCSLPIA